MSNKYLLNYITIFVTKVHLQEHGVENPYKRLEFKGHETLDSSNMYLGNVFYCVISSQKSYNKQCPKIAKSTSNFSVIF